MNASIDLLVTEVDAKSWSTKAYDRVKVRLSEAEKSRNIRQRTLPGIFSSLWLRLLIV